ncbi:MAG: ABC transporter substrate-binding protein [Nitrososphaerota archaeon]|nr:ABC transporter substrate-binding protein [Candidatus Bathyarchaeota archaeon]MDW8049052.1 ABC transporter substrate-binding protein [Nitrososphaerota archaeon]
MVKGFLGKVLLVILVFILMLPLIAIPIDAQQVPNGPWVDKVVFSSVTDSAQAITMLEAGDAHAYYFALVDAQLFQRVRRSTSLWYALSYGTYNEFTFNPVGPEFPTTGKLNPFSVPRIREAMNYLIDRDYIANEICGGLAVPRYTVLTPSFPDYARLIDVCKKIELQYAYNFDKAKAIVTEEMRRLNATLVGGKWYYKGEPVTIILLIRTEDERRQMGDYLANQLELLGFTTDRQYKRSAEAAPIWQGDPKLGLWHIYTGGWVTTAISRDQSGNFEFFYTPRGLAIPLWQAYTPDPEFDNIALRLTKRDFGSWEERNELMARALELSMKDSVRIWVVNRISAWVARNEIIQTYDLAGGFYGARLWPYTIRYKGQIGGTVKIITQAEIPGIDPWNPLGGSNWVYDTMIYRATFDPAAMPDPYTGLFWPVKFVSAKVYAKTGTPMTKTLDWVTLSFVDKIEVPTDAWYGWNATTQQIVYAPQGLEATAKVVVTFRSDLFQQKYHDGTNISLADFIFNYIITFDRADKASPVYDESYVSTAKAFMSYFKGFKIISQNPLICEFYTDNVYPDAEWVVADVTGWFDPTAAFGPSPWHIVTIGLLAEEKGLAAFTSAKATKLKVDRLNYIAGGTLTTLMNMLTEAISKKYIPYENVLKNYLTQDHALARYQALKSWYERRGHFWVGDGPFYLKTVNPTAHIVEIEANREYSDRADKWGGFGEPKLPEITIEGPIRVIGGLGAKFNVKITTKGTAYKVSEIESVSYLVVDASGKVGLVGKAEPVEDGLWTVGLEAADTSALPSGSSKLLVVASSKLVSIPSMKEASFVMLSLDAYIGERISSPLAQVQAKISTLEGSVSSLEQQIKSLQSSVSTMNTFLMVSIGIAVFAVALAAFSIIVKKK